jgi:hypothetical protein
MEGVILSPCILETLESSQTTMQFFGVHDILGSSLKREGHLIFGKASWQRLRAIS